MSGTKPDTFGFDSMFQVSVLVTMSRIEKLNEHAVSLLLYNLYIYTEGKLKADFQSVLCTLESLFMFFVLLHVRHHKM